MEGARARGAVLPRGEPPRTSAYSTSPQRFCHVGASGRFEMMGASGSRQCQPYSPAVVRGRTLFSCGARSDSCSVAFSASKSAAFRVA